MTSVYVHFPWCLAKCPYCDFVSYATERLSIDQRGYTEAVLRELDARARELGQGRTVESVFFGGGTPSLWDARELGRVVARVRERFDVAREAELEVTVECNPTSLDEDRARALVDVGVNRLSIGVQSLRDERLKHLGRLHDARGAIKVLEDAQRAGVPRISGDLIFGTPGQTPEQARAEALELADVGLRHLSCYQLTIEPGTRFGELARLGRLPLADESAVADAFVAIDEALESRGLEHYEISNYARPGEEARHNLGYWRGGEYIGVGCAAYGFAMTGASGGVRWRNPITPEGYVKATDTMSGVPEGEALDGETLLRERIMLGLRVRDGVDVDQHARTLGVEGWTEKRERAAAWLEERGRIERDGSRVRVPRRAWLWTDDTAARLF